MNSLFFGKDWPQADKKIFWPLAAAAIFALSFFWYVYAQDTSLAFTWDQFQRLEISQVTLRTFTLGLTNIEVPADQFLLYETFLGSSFQSLPWVFYLFLACLATGLVISITLLSTLKRFSFLMGMGLFILVMVSLRLESLELFGQANKIATIISLLLYGAAAFYFQSFRTHTTFNLRLVVFASLTIALGILFFTTSKVAHPFLHLAANGLITGMVLTIIFIFMVAHEIVASFIFIVTKNPKPSKSAWHYFIISAIYFFNLLLTYLIKEGQLSWNIFSVNLFFLLTISSVLALWGVRNREPLYADTVASSSFAIYFFLALFVVAFATLGFFFATGSSTMTEGFNDLIIYSHLGYGLIFIVYVIANFAPMLMGNLPVHKILYKPSTMPFFTFRVGGLIATYAFLSFASNWSSYVNQAYAAYYNAYGDIYYMQADATTAEAYFKKSIFHRDQNLHAHYALATIYTAQLDPNKERIEYANACEDSPSEMAFINLSEAYGRNGNSLGTATVLGEGLRKFKESGVLQNAQALAFSKLGSRDSALFLFQQARKSSLTKDAADANLLATSAQFKMKFPADSLLTWLGSDQEGAKSNALALANVQRLPMDIKYNLPSDTLFTVRQAALLNNYLINQRKKIDTVFLSTVETLARKPVNENFKEELLISTAQAHYEQGRVKKASELVREMAYPSGRGKYFNLLGVWLLEQGNPATAARYFKVANEKSIPLAAFHQALAWTEADSLAKAIPLWQELAQLKDTVLAKQAALYLRITNSTTKEILAQSDQEKYAFCKYKISLNDSSAFSQVLQSISTEDIKARAILDRSKKWFAQDESLIAVDYLSLLKGMKLTDKNLAEDILYFNLLLAAEKENWDGIQKQLTSGLQEGHPNEKIYLEALFAERQNKTEEAKAKFNYLATANFQFEEALLASTRFFLKDSTDRLKPYSILVNGLLAKPNSIKLLKAYVKEAAILGFDEESELSLEKLKKLMSARAFRRYVEENPDFFSVE
ncbi:MAG: tetratricopeptide repeat protein [Cyclobacteriaceae bacterium]